MKSVLVIKHKFAEAWLCEACELLCKRYESIGFKAPIIRVLYGFTTNGYITKRGRSYLGECLANSWSKNGENIIIIPPKIKHPVDILSILGHEIAHAIDNCKSDHGKDFMDIMKRYGYLYQGKSDFAGKELIKFYRETSIGLGLFPGVDLAN